ncbi:sugar ABC transporter permease [Rhodobacteraceae bacterium M385]|nr:sugar ABC transporter permease [Rhodobacteraceae bacterium M385]
MASVTTDTPMHSSPAPRRKISQQAIAPWLFLLPAFLFFATYVLYPIIQSFYISLYEWNGLYSPQYRGIDGFTDQQCLDLGNRAGREPGCELTGDTVWNAEYVGMENYRNLYTDPFFWTSLKNNVIWLLLYFLAIPAGLMISLFLNQKVVGMRLYKSLFFFPFVLSQVVVGLVFSWFMLPGADEGLLNVILGWFGAGPVNILGNNSTATYGIIAAGLWPQTAYCMILYLTGLNAVDPEQIEAARLDGAKGPKMLWYVVLPQLWPATFIAIVVTVIGALRSFDLITIMTNGGPGFYNTSVLAFYMYDVALSEFGFRMGYGSAIAVILFLIMMVYIAGFLWKMWRDEKV